MTGIGVGEEKKHYNLDDLDRTKNYHRLGTSTINPNLEDGLFNDLDPAVNFKRERPNHRIIQDMSLRGFTNKEIAGYLECSIPTVSNALRQPYARQRMIKKSMDSVKDELQQLLQNEVMPAIKVLTEIRDNSEAPAVARIQASRELLDRFLGKSSQPISVEEKPVEKLSNEELEKKVAMLVAGATGVESESELDNENSVNSPS